MKTWSSIVAILKADYLERTRRSSFLVTVCLVIYLGYAVNTGQILIKLDTYRGIYNSAWVGSLMALVITFFLGLAGFFLVKNAVERDERTGVGQIIATTPLTRPQYLLGKWLSNWAVLATLVGILAVAAILMQLIQREDAQMQLWPLLAPFLFIALPMMALVAAWAVFFETVPWLKGGFGNLVYFFVFVFMLIAGIQLTQMPWLDVMGINFVGTNMKAAARAAFPTYTGSFTLAMISGKPLETFVWFGLDWSLGLILQRLLWVVISMGVALSGSLFFNRFDSTRPVRAKAGRQPRPAGRQRLPEETLVPAGDLKVSRLTLLAPDRRFQVNFLRLAWLEGLLLVKGLKWYWLAGMAAVWIGCAASPSDAVRNYWFMLVGIWPVLVWSKMGEREIRHQAEALIFQAAYPVARLLGAAWLAGVILTAMAASGVLVGRLIAAEPLALLPWSLSVLFIPTLALTLGVWSRSSKLFELVYPILWYLGPFNPKNELAVLDYLGVHPEASVITSPLWVAGLILLLLFLALVGRSRQSLA